MRRAVWIAAILVVNLIAVTATCDSFDFDLAACTDACTLAPNGTCFDTVNRLVNAPIEFNAELEAAAPDRAFLCASLGDEQVCAANRPCVWTKRHGKCVGKGRHRPCNVDARNKEECKETGCALGDDGVCQAKAASDDIDLKAAHECSRRLLDEHAHVACEWDKQCELHRSKCLLAREKVCPLARPDSICTQHPGCDILNGTCVVRPRARPEARRLVVKLAEDAPPAGNTGRPQNGNESLNIGETNIVVMGVILSAAFVLVVTLWCVSMCGKTGGPKAEKET